MPNEDYYSPYSGEEIDALLQEAGKAKEYAERAEQSLAGIADIERAAPEIIRRIEQSEDAIGRTRSINQFPIDVANNGEGVEYDIAGGQLLIDKLYAEQYIDAIVFIGGSGDTALEDSFSFFFNTNNINLEPKYQQIRTTLMSGDYILSIDADVNAGEWDSEDGYIHWEVYADDGTAMWFNTNLIASTDGDAVPFTVVDNQKICIKVLVKRYEGKSWEDKGIVLMPFLRRREYLNESRDSFTPSVQDIMSQLNYRVTELDEHSGGGRRSAVLRTANIVSRVTTKAQEVTQ